MKLNILITLLALLLSTSAFCRGGVNGGGSDHLPDDFGAAWFLEGMPARSIKVCFKQDFQKFPMQQSLVVESFKSAMDMWIKYIDDKKVNVTEPQEDDEIDPLYTTLVTRYEILAECGQEDLTVYLGFSTPVVEEIRAKLFDPYALAHKVSYDTDKGWGKGFIWLRGVTDEKFLWDKNALLNLKGVLIHELGHVFGNDHRDGTIMASSFSEQLSEDEILDGGLYWDFYKFSMTHIDWSEELVQCLNCKFLHEGGTLWLTGSRTEKETFKFLTGSALNGTATAKVEVKDFRSDVFEGAYTVSDSQKTVSYPITLMMNSMNFSSGEGAVFKRVVTRSEAAQEEGGLATIYFHNSSSDFSILSFSGWMEKDGRNIPIIFEGKSSPYELKAKYPEDEIKNGYIEKTYPYRLIALDGKERYVLFTKLNLIKFDDETGEGKSSQVRHIKHLLQTP